MTAFTVAMDGKTYDVVTTDDRPMRAAMNVARDNRWPWYSNVSAETNHDGTMTVYGPNGESVRVLVSHRVAEYTVKRSGRGWKVTRPDGSLMCAQLPQNDLNISDYTDGRLVFRTKQEAQRAIAAEQEG